MQQTIPAVFWFYYLMYAALAIFVIWRFYVFTRDIGEIKQILRELAGQRRDNEPKS